jgi:hypothetical protein
MCLCDDAFVRDPVDIAAGTLGAPLGTESSIEMSDYGFPVFQCTRIVTTDDVKALDDEEQSLL